MCQALVVSERRACKILGQARATQRHHSPTPSDEKRLTEEIITLATKYGRYGYRRTTALLNNEKGWRVNHRDARTGITNGGRSLICNTYSFSLSSYQYHHS
ncbi:MAG: hypothetical protein CL874_02265 [Dehalococcoidales bacterium]|nr:hypothetical protein [Dehalococcoidales bacterium]